MISVSSQRSPKQQQQQQQQQQHQQQQAALVALAEDLSLVPSRNMGRLKPLVTT